MRLFKRKRRGEVTGMPGTNTVQLNTVLPSYSTHSLSFEHSTEFIIDGIDPLSDERELLKSVPEVDWMLHDKRDPEIKADSRKDIDYGKRQFINHIFTTRAIIAQCAGELVLARDMDKLIDEEIVYYENLENSLQVKR